MGAHFSVAYLCVDLSCAGSPKKWFATCPHDQTKHTKTHIQPIRSDNKSKKMTGLGSQGRPGLTRQACARKTGLGSQGRPGLTRHAWAHKASLGSQGRPGLTRHAWAHKARLGPSRKTKSRKNKIAKNRNRKKTNVSPTPNAYFSGQQFLSRGQCVKYSI